MTYLSKGWQTVSGIHKVMIPPGKSNNESEATYFGEWKDGNRHGFGTYECEEFSFTGFWEADYIGGWGEKFMKLGEYQGDKHVGLFKKGVREG